MRKMIVSMAMSLDGFVEGVGKDVMALPFDDGFSANNVERLRAADVSLLGRTSFEGMRDYWPDVADDRTQNETEREISRLNNAIAKVVVSDTMKLDDAGVYRDTTRIVRRDEAASVIRELKQEQGADIITFGSRVTWSPLLAKGLVDELHILVGPRVLGGGTSLFAGSESVSLRLVDSRQLPDSQLVLLRYFPETAEAV